LFSRQHNRSKACIAAIADRDEIGSAVAIDVAD
jgi:hypothetical protein